MRRSTLPPAIMAAMGLVAIGIVAGIQESEGGDLGNLDTVRL
jgi:hypothetical protein